MLACATFDKDQVAGVPPAKIRPATLGRPLHAGRQRELVVVCLWRFCPGAITSVCLL